MGWGGIIGSRPSRVYQKRVGGGGGWVCGVWVLVVWRAVGGFFLSHLESLCRRWGGRGGELLGAEDDSKSNFGGGCQSVRRFAGSRNVGPTLWVSVMMFHRGRGLCWGYVERAELKSNRAKEECMLL